MDNFKNIIAKRRKELKMTQRDLAKKINVSDKTISKWETGGSYPDATVLSTLAKALEIDISELFGAEDLKEKSVEIEEYDYSLISKFKNTMILVLGLTILAIVTFVLGGILLSNDKTAFNVIIILSVIIFISSIIILFININSFRTKYINKFYRREYDIAYYNYTASYVHFMAMLVVLVPIFINRNLETTPLALILFIYLILTVKKKANLKFQKDKINLILIIISLSILIFKLIINIYYTVITILGNFNGLIIFPFIEQLTLVGYILFIVLTRRFIYDKK